MPQGIKGFLTGTAPWNKGLTKETHPSLANVGIVNKERLEGKTYEEMYGLEKSLEIRKKHSEKAPWNKGLTKETDERVAKYGRSTSKNRTGKPHKEDCKCPFCEAKRGTLVRQPHKTDCNCCFCKGKRGEKVAWNKGLTGVKTFSAYIPIETRTCLCGCGQTFECRVTSEKNFLNKKHSHVIFMGKNNHNWIDDRSSLKCFEEYGVEFDTSLKEQVRFRDKYTCQICGCSQLENGKQLSIHHKDYDKKNNNINNLIALCIRCHVKTNRNRETWKIYFENRIGEENAS